MNRDTYRVDASCSRYLVQEHPELLDITINRCKEQLCKDVLLKNLQDNELVTIAFNVQISDKAAFN